MTSDQALNHIKFVLTTYHDCDALDVGVGTHFIRDLGFDSLDKVDFVMQIEDECNVSLHDEDLERCTTVGDLAHLLETIQ